VNAEMAVAEGIHFTMQNEFNLLCCIVNGFVLPEVQNRTGKRAIVKSSFLGNGVRGKGYFTRQTLVDIMLFSNHETAEWCTACFRH
jgi:hypothetical protein